MIGALKKIDGAIAAVELALALAFLGTMLVLTSIPIVLRATGGNAAAFSWTSHVSLYMLLTGTFLGASLAMRQRRHIQIDIVTRGLPRRGKAGFGVLGWLVCAAIMGVLCYAAFHYVGRNWTQSSKLRGIPLGPIQVGMPISLGIMAWRCLLHSLEDLRGVATGDLAYMAEYEHSEAKDMAEGHPVAPSTVPPPPVPPQERAP